MPDRSLEVSRVGQQIGNYRLMQLLGQGGFAEVYLGQHLYLPRQAAIKLLLSSSLTSSESKKFRAEASIVASLRHPHIVQILDFGVDPASQLPYLVMVYAPNGTLRQLHPRGSILPPSTILAYVRQIASALDFAHCSNIVHRDVKPENMLLTDGEGESDPNILLSDFGIAMLTEKRPEISMGSVPEMAGTPYYMAPEQLRGKAVKASDQYALGVVVYEWLCGQTPFRGSLPRVANQHLNASPPPPSEHNPPISPELEDVVLRALSKSPTRRYASVSDFAAAFAEALQPSVPPSLTSSSSVVPPRASDQLTHSTHVQNESTIADVPGPRRGPMKRRALLVGLGGLAVAGGALWVGERVRSGQASMKQLSQPTNHKTDTVPTKGAVTSTDLGKLYSFHRFSNTVSSVAWLSGTSMIASGCYDNTASVWDLNSDTIINFQGHLDQVTSVAWSPDGKYIATGSFDKTVLVWSLTNRTKPIFSCSGHTDRVYAVAWSPDGKYIASGSADNTVRIWNAKDGKNVSVYSDHSQWVRAVSWSPNGKYIASAGHDGAVQIRDFIANRIAYTHFSVGSVIYTLAWSPDGKSVASGTFQGIVDVWNALDGKQTFSFTQHSDSVFAVSWSPDNNHIASGSADHTVRVWSSVDGTSLFNYRGHNDTVDAVTWSRDSRRIASGSADKLLQIWQAT